MKHNGNNPLIAVPFTTLAAIVITLLSCLISVSALNKGTWTHKVVSIRFQKQGALSQSNPNRPTAPKRRALRMRERDDGDLLLNARDEGTSTGSDDDTVHQLLENEGILYLANVTIGTPPQSMQLQIDTASSDIWVLSKSVPACSDPNNYDLYSSTCSYGSFDPELSESFTLLGADKFSISYVDGSNAFGDYAEDTFAVGGAIVEGMQIGVAKSANLSYGVMGVGFEEDQASTVEGGMGSYPNLVNEMVTQGLIRSKAFSLWLDDLASDTGSILFGGVDKARFKGNLTIIPLLPPQSPDHPPAFAIPLTSVGLSDGTSHYNITSGSLPSTVILDSGTSLTFLPHPIASSLANQLGGKISPTLNLYIIDCNHPTDNAYIEFQFAYQLYIKVPMSELILPLTEYSGDTAKAPDGSDICALGFAPSPEPINLFGDTFLRSAYVVFDLENQRVAIAQTDFDPVGQNILEIGEGKNSIPWVGQEAPAMTIAVVSSGGSTNTAETGKPTSAALRSCRSSFWIFLLSLCLPVVHFFV